MKFITWKQYIIIILTLNRNKMDMSRARKQYIFGEKTAKDENTIGVKQQWTHLTSASSNDISSLNSLRYNQCINLTKGTTPIKK